MTLKIFSTKSDYKIATNIFRLKVTIERSKKVLEYKWLQNGLIISIAHLQYGISLPLHEHAELSKSKDKTACLSGEYPVGSGANLLRQATQIK